jgi:hypothetical protein
VFSIIPNGNNPTSPSSDLMSLMGIVIPDSKKIRVSRCVHSTINQFIYYGSKRCRQAHGRILLFIQQSTCTSTQVFSKYVGNETKGGRRGKLSFWQNGISRPLGKMRRTGTAPGKVFLGLISRAAIACQLIYCSYRP